MDILEAFLSLGEETKYSRAYLNICLNHFLYRTKSNHTHHFLPKSLFPEFSDFKANPWNKIVVSARVHYILHLLLGFHFRKNGRIIDSISMFRAVKNFKSCSKHYELFRNVLSEQMKALWKHPKWRKETTRKISESTVLRYKKESERQKTREASIRAHSLFSEEKRESISKRISETLLNRSEEEKRDTVEKFRKYIETAEFKEKVDRMRITINSVKYRKEKFKVCEWCGKSSSPSNYSQHHGKYCDSNPNKVAKDMYVCDVCGEYFYNIKNHKRSSKTCNSETYACVCSREFKTKAALTIHRKKCKYE